MTHYIYIYFIINSTIAGYMFAEKEKWRFVLGCILIGLPAAIIYLIALLIAEFLGWINKELQLKTFWHYFIIKKPFEINRPIEEVEKDLNHIAHEIKLSRWQKMIWRRFAKVHGLKIDNL